MTDQPTNGPWELAPEGTYPAGEGYKVLGPWFETKAGHKTRCYVAQFMTKADAEFLVRAQHMDELEKVARDAREALAECIGYVPAWAREKHGMDAELARIDAILAKIKGDQ